MSTFIKPFLKQTVASVCSPTTNGYGDKTWNVTASKVPVRFQYSARLLLSDSGEQILARAEIWHETAYTVANGYRITYSGEHYMVVRVETHFDLFGRAEFKKMIVV